MNFYLAILPPKANGTFILIDPLYEDKDERKKLARCLTEAISRCRHGVYLIWFPLTAEYFRFKLPHALGSLYTEQNHWLLTIKRNTQDNKNLKGMFLFLVNPPFGIEKRVENSLRNLAMALG